MHGKDNLESLIISYLLGELDQMEQASALERIRADEKSRQLYEELKKAVKLVLLRNAVEHTDLDKEWNSFEEARLLKSHPQLFLNEAERFGNGIITEVNLKRKTRIFRIVSLSAVAASMLMATSLGIAFFAQQKRIGPVVAGITKQKNLRLHPVTRHLVTYAGDAKYFLLQDGTAVWLAANSELKFREPFEADRREIYLTGSAYFSVAKNPARPFTVYSAGIATTALGTRFTVTAFKHADRIMVALHEGKVVVKGVDELKDKVKKVYYLVPGQEFVFEKKLKTPVHVQNISAEPASAAEKPSVPYLGKGSWYMFNNQSLNLVLEQLKSIYKTDIVYNKEDISKMYFIGTFSQGDSLETVLKQIAVINDLMIVREHRKFVVMKQQ